MPEEKKAKKERYKTLKTILKIAAGAVVGGTAMRVWDKYVLKKALAPPEAERDVAEVVATSMPPFANGGQPGAMPGMAGMAGMPLYGVPPILPVLPTFMSPMGAYQPPQPPPMPQAPQMPGATAPVVDIEDEGDDDVDDPVGDMLREWEDEDS